jgi:hypothetical protein
MTTGLPIVIVLYAPERLGLWFAGPQSAFITWTWIVSFLEALNDDSTARIARLFSH